MHSEKIIAHLYESFFESNPIQLVDIGSSGGLNPNWKDFERFIEIIGFEPDVNAFNQLVKESNTHKKYYNTGVHSEKCDILFYLYKDRQKSSLFEPNMDFLKQFPKWERFEVEYSENVSVNLLDNIFLNQKVSPDFLKIDTEGNDLSILKGGINTIASDIFGIEVEVGFAEIRKNQPFFADIDIFLRENGFQLFDIRRTYWKRSIGEKYGKDKGQLVLGDALYFKNIPSFCASLQNIQDTSIIKSKIVKAISICIMYGYYDYALELVQYSMGTFNNSEHIFLTQQIQSSISTQRKIPLFWGRGKLARLCQIVEKIMALPGWATGDLELDLGNR